MKEKEKSLPPKEQRLADLKHLRDDFLNDLPPEIVSFADPNYYSYRCRCNYFTVVVSSLEEVVGEGDISDPVLQQEVIGYVNYVCHDHDFFKFTTRKDLDRVDKVLDDVIAYLS